MRKGKIMRIREIKIQKKDNDGNIGGKEEIRKTMRLQGKWGEQGQLGLYGIQAIMCGKQENQLRLSK